MNCGFCVSSQYEPRHDKTNKMSVLPTKTQISLGSAVWSESSLCAQSVAKKPSFLYEDSDDSDQTSRMPRLIWVLAGRTAIVLGLSFRGLYGEFVSRKKFRRYRIWKRIRRYQYLINLKKRFLKFWPRPHVSFKRSDCNMILETPLLFDRKYGYSSSTIQHYLFHRF